MSIYHIHHIIPRHMGGSDDSSNLVKVTVEEHANLHKQLWEDFGYDEDRLAWLGLSKMIDKDRHIYEMSILAGKKTVTMQVGIHDPNKKYLKSKGGKNGIKTLDGFIENSKWMNNGVKDTRVPFDKVQFYIKKGWSMGRLFSANRGKKNITKNLFWIHKEGVNKRVPEDQVKNFIN